jgi:SOS response associated peptidase (SRAP)
VNARTTVAVSMGNVKIASLPIALRQREATFCHHATARRRSRSPGWDEWRDKANGQTLKSCTMIITEPNDFVAEVHDRMPVLLAEKDFEPWLSGSAGLELLKPAAEDLLQRLPVSKRVNSSRAADEGCDALTPCHWPQLRRRQR